MITRLFNNAHVLFQPTNDNGFNEVAIGASVDDGGMIVLEQEGRHIVIDPASVNELCRLLKKLHKESANG
ncbi:hypothetical protein D3C81_594710 [compost metagenome]